MDSPEHLLKETILQHEGIFNLILLQFQCPVTCKDYILDEFNWQLRLTKLASDLALRSSRKVAVSALIIDAAMPWKHFFVGPPCVDFT